VRKSYRGYFFPKNPKKYKGDVNNIVYRSLWERKVFSKLDIWDNVLEWSSEEIIIRYRSPIDMEIHRYFPDVYVKMKTKDDKIIEMVLEVKPLAQTLEPKKPKRITKRYLEELATYGINQAKFKAASAWCADRGWKFQLITEKNIFGKK